MSRNGAGTYSLPSGNPVVTGTTISSTTHNSTNTDIATALTQSLAYDGQTVPIANLPMATYRHTGVGSGVARTDYAALGQQQDGTINWVAAGGTADALTATYSPVVTALVDGQICFVRATATNATTTPTFAPNGLTARTITKLAGTAIVAGEWVNLQELILRYNLANTRWELLNPKKISPANVTAGTFAGSMAFSAATVFSSAVSLAGDVTASADVIMAGSSIIETEGAAVTAASSTNIWATDGNTVHVTGNTGINDFGTAPQVGAWMKIIFDGTPLLTQSTNLNLNGGGANIQIAADDMAFVYADTTTQMDVIVFRKSGAAIVPTSAATQAQMEADSSNSVFVSPGLIRYAPSVSKAWVNFDGASGGVATIKAQYNTSSVSRTGAGAYTITWSNSYSSADYAIVGMARENLTIGVDEANLPTASVVKIQTRNNGGSLTDSERCSVASLGDY